MGRIVYVNGEYLDETEAKVSVFDRGFLFADAVYEVTSVVNGKLIDNKRHLNRLNRSLSELGIVAPETDEAIEAVQIALLEKNQLDQGLVYLQISRGEADRDFSFPENTTASLVAFTQIKDLVANPQAEKGIAVITTPEIRWQRRDIKTVALLASSMAKMSAKKAGADDAWFVENGSVTEGCSSNAFIIKKEGTLVTRHLGNEILAGITREAVLSLAESENLTIEERRFSVEEAKKANEAFLTSSSTFVIPVTSLDGEKIGDGNPGPMTKKLRQLYVDIVS